MDYSKILCPSINNTIPIISDGFQNCSMKNELIKENHSGPVERRKPTNVEFLVVFGIAVFVWFLLAFYCIYYGDLSRLDMELTANQTTSLKEFAKDVRISSGEIYLACTSAVLFSAILIVLFRRFAGAIIWFIIGLVLTTMILSTLTFWVVYGQKTGKVSENSFYPDINTDDSDSNSLTAAVTATVFTVVIALVIYAIRKHIRMVIRLFKEGGKVAESMPLILAQPFVTFVALAVTIFLCAYFALWIETSGIPTTNMGGVQYQKNGIMMFAAIYNLLVGFWIVQFFIACQHMVIAGSTATWYFTRNKTDIGSAILTSYKYLLKYHLGSVALGSLIVTTVQIIRSIVRATIKKNARNVIGCLLGGLFKSIERFITFLTRNAYIEVAIYGDGFFTSGKRALQVLTNNVIKVTTINSVGDFVMILGRFLVTGLAVLVGYLLLQEKPDLTNINYPLAVIGFISFAIVHAFMLVFEMIVDSLFICFCEDCDINDGKQKPYYMSKEMMVFINKDSPKTLRVGDAAVE